MKEDCIQISSYPKTIDQWMVEMNIPSELRTKISTSDVILLPVGYHNKPLAFANGAYEFMEYCIGQNKLSIEICCSDEDFTQIEMCSFQLRLGRYLLPSAIMGMIFWNLIPFFDFRECDRRLTAMPMDGFTLSFMQHELYETLLGGRVDKVNQPERDFRNIFL